MNLIGNVSDWLFNAGRTLSVMCLMMHSLTTDTHVYKLSRDASADLNFRLEHFNISIFVIIWYKDVPYIVISITLTYC